jgi:D-3-phosphoglycerate dehydrogenase / 2-oxoglutarate reductase
MSDQQKILVWADLAPDHLTFLENEGFLADDARSQTAAEVAARIALYDGLIVDPRRGVSADLVSAARRLRIIARAGAGVEGVAVEAATRAGVIVADAPDSNAASEAELALALLLAVARPMARADAGIRAGAWDERGWADAGIEVRGKTVGLLGSGAGAALFAQSAQALGMNVVSSDDAGQESPVAGLGLMFAPLAHVLAAADLLLVWPPANAPVALGATELGQAKPGVRVVSMGGLAAIDAPALGAALRGGRVAAAALAVAPGEADAARELAAAGDVLLAPRLEASTADARRRAGMSAAEQVAAALRGELPPHAVNVPLAGAPDAPGLMPYLGLCGQLGRLLVQLADQTVDAVEIAYDGAFAYFDTRLLTLAVLGGVLSGRVEGPVNFVNAEQLATEHGVAARETRNAGALDFPRMITVSTTASHGAVSVAGTSFGAEHKPRLVKLFGEDVDIEPAAHMAFLRYVDVPGVGGAVGTLLGQWRINIGHLSVGRGRLGDEAVMALTLDEPLSAAQMQELAERCGLAFARAAEL